MKKRFLYICLLLISLSSISFKIQDEGKYRLANIESDGAFEKWFKNLQLMVSQNQKEQIASMVHFPLDIILEKRELKINTKKEFLKKYNSLFSKEVKEVIIKQKIRNLTVTSEGVMIGGGQMWINPIHDKDGYWITAVNNNFDKDLASRRKSALK